jgi:DNA-binding PadR family transcriptional regulator
VAFSGKEEIVIDILREREMYGLEIIKKSNGDLKRGSIYATLACMEERGLVSARTTPATHPQGMPRRMYRVTESGMKEVLHRHSCLPVATLVSA